MASIIREQKGRKIIQFSERELTGRPKVRLGKMSIKDANGIRIRLEFFARNKKVSPAN